MLIASALGVVATWVLITVVLIGLGSVLLKLFEIEISLIDAFWMGLAVSVAILEIWNLLLPVTDPSCGTVLVLNCEQAAG